MQKTDWATMLFPRDDYKQTYRIKRFFMALAVYAFCLCMVYLSYLVGIMEWDGFAGLLIAIPFINICLYLLFRSGLNLKMSDPSLTSVQMYAGALVTMYGMYYTNESRGVMLLFYIVILLFGSFRLDTRGFLHVSIFILVSYLVNIILLCNNRPQHINVETEFVQLLMLASILVIFTIIGGQISALLQQLKNSKVQQAKYIEAIRELAIRDELTGLYNRRYLMELIDFEKNRSVRDSSTFCIGLMDIDHFKKVNDIYGHLAGDMVLGEVAAIMDKTLRNTEFCGRYGGEEFLIVLTQTDCKGALNAVERVRGNIESLTFPHIDTSLKVTVSIGVAEYRKGEAVNDAIARADQAMYRAKEMGRNRIETSGGA